MREKKPATACRQELEVGVWWMVQRGWRASQARLAVLVAAVSVEDGVDQPARRHGRSAAYGVKEPEELLVAVPRHAPAEHRAVEHLEGGEQRRRAVADIVVGHGPGLPG